MKTCLQRVWLAPSGGSIRIDLRRFAQAAGQIFRRLRAPHDSSASSRRQVDPDATVYRLARSSGEVDEDNQRFQAVAFQRRRNEQELSLILAEGVSRELAGQTLKKCYGVATLRVGAIQELGLEVYPTQGMPGYAHIAGLPDPESDRFAAEDMGNALLDLVQATVVWKPPKNTDPPTRLTD